MHQPAALDGAAAHVLQLDALRGLAAIVVLIGHLAQLFWQPFVEPGHALVHGFATASRHAVLVFFLLSGYLISGGMRRSVQVQRSFLPGPYAVARLARLWPPLLGALLVTALSVLVLSRFSAAAPPAGAPAGLQAQALEYLTALFLLRGLEQANPVLWSLYIEARLYLIAGLAFWAWTRRPRAHAGLAAALALAAVCVVERADFLVFAAVWLIGAGAALLPLRWQRWRRRCSATALAGLLLLLAWQPARLSMLEPQPLVQAGAQLLAGLAYATLLFDLRWPRWGLVLPASAAAFSYTLYLVHWPLLVVLATLLQPTVASHWPTALLGTAVGALSALLLAWALARPLEQAARFRGLILAAGRSLRWRRRRVP